MPCLLIIAGPNEGLLFTVEGGETVIGRGDGCCLQLVDEKASRKHCCIKRHEGGTLGGTGIPSNQYVLSDLGSSNGTTLDGQACRDETLLKDGDTIGVGTSRMAFINETFETVDKAKAHLQSIGKAEATQGEDAWPLDPPWKTQTLSEVDPRDLA